MYVWVLLFWVCFDFLFCCLVFLWYTFSCIKTLHGYLEIMKKTFSFVKVLLLKFISWLMTLERILLFLLSLPAAAVASPSLFLLHWLSICFHVFLKNILFSIVFITYHSLLLVFMSYAVVTTAQLCGLYSKLVSQRDYLAGKHITQWGWETSNVKDLGFADVRL